MTIDPRIARASLGISFSLLARRWRRALDAQLAELGLTSAVWVPLVHLHRSGGGITQKELAQRVGVEGASVVRLIDILVRQGLVERRIDQADARARLIYLTPAGAAEMPRIRARLTDAEAELLQDLDDAEIGIVLDCLARIDQRLSAMETRRREGDDT